MTVLVVGGGFIGSPVVRQLVDRGESVVCLDRDAGAIPDVDGVEAVEADITDREAVAAAVEAADPDRIVHLAYMLAAEMERHPTRAMQVDCVGVDNVFNVAAEAGIERVVFASSSAVYGRPGNYEGTVSEDATIPAAFTEFPTYLYAATKQLNEYQARNYTAHTDLDVVCVRPSLVFGPGRGSGATKWASSFITDPARGETGHLPLRPDERLGMVYYRDVARLFVELALADAVAHDAYNTGGHVVSVREAAELVADLFGADVTWDDDADPLSLVADLSGERARAEFDYDLTPLEDALRDHGDRVT
ncbi:NAD-dependent epimerase/dehydratase family protein [Halobellus limi]|uniref:NAD(P)-dependent oxidoreductase n=1 Tax=Halobellus limi TaxID=699433 RepID=A0A1H6BQ48_9EURY|nr:NAD(P)-dependent oxidoreductase [Halobellus limi]QCC49385.1 NAD(P)-dependent oxidoreductase [Halobellus limi]SEG62828.1 Nucleoside-diphosphate-sugar epimerase [Halobellus limi]